MKNLGRIFVTVSLLASSSAVSAAASPPFSVILCDTLFGTPTIVKLDESRLRIEKDGKQYTAPTKRCQFSGHPAKFDCKFRDPADRAMRIYSAFSKRHTHDVIKFFVIVSGSPVLTLTYDAEHMSGDGGQPDCKMDGRYLVR